MKHLWLINHYAKTPNDSGGTRHFSLAKQLKNLGWQAVIIAASTSADSEKPQFENGKVYLIKEISGVTFCWIKCPNYKGNGIGRVINMVLFSWRLLFVGSSLPAKPDIVVGSSVHPLAAASAWVVARRFHVPFLFEVRDLWPQTLIDLGRIHKHGLFALVLRTLEHFLYVRAVAIITLLPNAAKYITTFGIDPTKIKYVPNGADLELMAPLRPKEKTKPTVLMYLGSFGNANGIDQLIEAMAMVQAKLGPDEIHMRLIGEGPLKEFYQSETKRMDLKCVSFHKSLPKNLLVEVAQEADAFVVCLPDIPLYQYGISLNKIYEYMAMGRPTVFAGRSSNDPIRESRGGFSVSSGNAQELCDSFVQLHKLSDQELNEMGRRARAFVEQNFTYRQISDRFAKILSECVTSEQGRPE